jgi:hypothetical protein
MIKSQDEAKNQKRGKKISGAHRYKKLSSIGEASKGILNDMSSPIDATNRFINLALQSIGENPQGRQFLIESKEGIRKTSLLLQKLSQNIRKFEEEIAEMARREEGQRQA